MTRRNLTLSMLLLIAGIAVVVALRWSAEGPTGEGGGPAAKAMAGLMLSPESLDFGDVPIGELSNRSVIATNVGEDPIVVELVRTEEPFRVTTAGFTLQPGDSKEVSVRFGSRDPGTWDAGALEFVSRDLGSAIVPMSAMVEIPQKVVVEPAALEFGDVAVGQIASAMVTISNPGKRPLRISGLGAISPFGSGGYPKVVDPGETIVVEVFYKPEAVGDSRGSFRIRSDDPLLPNTSISLKGTALPEEPDPRLVASNEALEFGQVAVGDVRTKWLAVTNRGYSSLMIRSVTTEKPFDGPSKSQRVRSGAVYRFPVTFAPQSEGALLGALMIHSNDPDAEPLVVSLVGQGVGEGTTDHASQPSGFPTRAPTRTGERGEGGEGGRSGGDTPYDHLPEWAWQGPSDSESGGGGTDPREALEPGDALYVSEGTIAVGARGAEFDQYTFDDIQWDGEQLVIDGMKFPTVEMPFGDSYHFEQVGEPVATRWEGDELVMEVPVVVKDGAGDVVEMVVELTTGTTEEVAGRERRTGDINGCSFHFVGQMEIPADRKWTETVISVDLQMQVPNCSG